MIKDRIIHLLLPSNLLIGNRLRLIFLKILNGEKVKDKYQKLELTKSKNSENPVLYINQC